MADPVTSYLASCRDLATVNPPPRTVLKATKRVLKRVAADPEILGQLAEALPTVSPAGAAWIAITLGSLVERGVDPSLAGPALLRYYVAELQNLPSLDGEEVVEPTPAQAVHLAAFDFLSQGVVAHLARLPELRRSYGADHELVSRLEELCDYGVGAFWVHSALARWSGPLIVLHPESATGFVLQVSNVGTCFHLFSLIQLAVGTSIPGGRTAAPELAECARGLRSAEISDEAWWHYGRPDAPTPDLMTSIWGEGQITEIPTVDSVPVILLWAPLMRRSWDAGFFYPHLDALPADVVVERRLEPAEVNDWLAKLNLAG